MFRNNLTYLLAAAGTFLFVTGSCSDEQKIDREALVNRNNPHVTEIDTMASLTVGNGEFAFTVDVTGLQTFPEMYSKGALRKLNL